MTRKWNQLVSSIAVLPLLSILTIPWVTSQSSAASKDGGWLTQLASAKRDVSNKTVQIRQASAIGGVESWIRKSAYHVSLTSDVIAVPKPVRNLEYAPVVPHFTELSAIAIWEYLFLHDAARWGGIEEEPDRVKDPGLYPDPVATPGEINPKLTKEVLCAPGFHTANYRHTPKAALKESDRFYKFTLKCISWAKSTPGAKLHCAEHNGERDHFVPIELGGADPTCKRFRGKTVCDMNNMWTQRGTSPGYHEKDLAENFLHREVCANRMSLESAQRAIVADWVMVWHQAEKEH